MKKTAVTLSILTALCANLPRPAHALTHMWSQGFTGASAQNIESVATDASGNIYAAGYFYGTINFGGGLRTSAGGSDIFLVKFDPAGAWQWDREFGDASDSQFATGVAIDGGGNIYISGAFTGSANFGGGVRTSAGDRDLFLAKFNAAGVHQWSKRFGDAAEQENSQLAIDLFGDIYMTGYFFGTLDFGGGPLTSQGSYDAFIVQFDAAGAHLWSKRFGDDADQRGIALTTNHWGNVSLGIDFNGTMDLGAGNVTSNGNFDVAVVQYSSLGFYQFEHEYGDAAGSQEVTSLATDPSEGYLYVAGTNTGTVDFGGGPITSAGTSDIFLAKLDCIGNHIWSHGWGDAAYQGVSSVVTDPFGDVFLAGGFDGTMNLGGGPLISAGLDDVFLAELDEDGTHMWSRRFGDPSKFQSPNCITTDPDGNAIMGGIFQGNINFGGSTFAGNSTDAFLVKFAAIPSAVRGPMNTSLSVAAHPNPFNPETTIRYTVPSKGHVEVAVYDASGARVSTLVNAEKGAGAYSQKWDGRDGAGRVVSSGVYFARVTHSSGTKTFKMVLLK
jgi:hypothetical protein